MRILAVTTVRDEGPFLLEWLAWHRLIGVSDLLVCSNDCSDGTDALLDALAAAGVLTHLRNPAKPGKSVQWQALKLAWQHPLRRAADWMLISDLDEFPMIHCGAHRLTDLIAALPEGTDAVALGWRLFGNGGKLGFHDQPITGQMLYAAPPEMVHPIAASSFKSLFRPRAFQRPGVHRPRQKPGQPAPAWVDGSGRPLPALYAEDDGRLSLLGLTDTRQLAEMHHYSLRSAESFLAKTARGLPNRSEKRLDLHYWVERNFNAVENRAALVWAPALAAEIAALKALPGVAALHDAACQHHRDTIARLLRQRQSYQLFCACAHVSGAAVLPDRLGNRLLQMFHALAPEREGEAGKAPETSR